MGSLRVVLRGNHSVSYSTESHLGLSWESLGWEVKRVQEDAVGWADTIAACEGADLFLFTSTWGMAHGWPQDEAWAAVETLNAMLPTVAMHLDLFFPIRSDQPAGEPWFHVRDVFTADGGHPDEFAAAGVRHHWMPPGIVADECYVGTPRRAYASPVAFVGSHQGHYHAESTHRHELVRHLRKRRDCRFWPRGPAVRGRDLNDLYASTKVVVGDSCMVPTIPNYWSDRIPETLGRGGFLLHPYVPGIEDHYTDGEHLRLWQAGDWAELDHLIRYYLAHEDERRAIALAGHEHVKATATYAHRCQQVLDTIGLGA